MDHNTTLYRVVHPNRGLLYVVAAGAIIVVGVYYTSQSYVIEEEIRTDEETRRVENQIQQEQIQREQRQNPSSGKVYINIKYGYRFNYPSTNPPYLDFDRVAKTFILPTMESRRVAVAQNQQGVFNGSSPVLDIQAIVTNHSAERWFNDNKESYANSHDVISTKNITVSGKPAIEMITRGRSSATIVHRLRVIQGNEFLIVITQSAPSAFLDGILASFRFF